MSHSENIQPGIDLRRGPVAYVNQCLDRCEVAPGITFRDWSNASEMGRNADHSECGGDTPTPWPAGENAANPPTQKSTPIRGGTELPHIEQASRVTIGVLVYQLLNRSNDAQVWQQTLTQMQSHIACELGVRDAFIRFGSNQGIAELQSIPSIDPTAAARQVMDTITQALQRYQQALRHETTHGRYSPGGRR